MATILRKARSIFATALERCPHSRARQLRGIFYLSSSILYLIDALILMPPTRPTRHITRIARRAAAQVSAIMRRVRGAGTQPEREFAKSLRKTGLRFRTHDARLPGKPDFVFPSKRLAVFVDGDFWHGHQWRERKHQSIDAQLARVRNRKYWLRKISRNFMRDFRTTASLLDSGWRVLRIWESTIRRGKDRCREMALTAVGFKSERKGEPSFSELSRLTAAEFFAGIGLVRLALERQG